MKRNAKKNNNYYKSSIGKKIILNIFSLVFIICISISANNKVSEAKNNEDKRVNVDSSTIIKNNDIHSTENVVKVGTIEYSIKSIEHQMDKNNPILGKESEYITITMTVKNTGNNLEVFNAFDMNLKADVNGENRVIRNIAETAIYEIPSKGQSDVKLVYIVPKNASGINIVSEKNEKIRLKIDID